MVFKCNHWRVLKVVLYKVKCFRPPRVLHLVSRISAVTERPCDALCPSIVSFNSTSSAVSYYSFGFRFTTAFCCLQPNFKASCHKHFVIHLLWSTNSNECHQLATVRCSYMYYNIGGRSHLWQHAIKPDISRELQFFPTLPAFKAPVRGVPVGILP